ncbi:hypothetical protein RJ640_023220 [Escallonia rubra]|uniref:Protein kinase domain-containing protein n=1 Tax=Escallonia rubra TaxID=112253 RepID=A0AA88UIU0_9ASTE|nr:hypothetical protein RJ640_023220 [Escallonia rubra]
MLRARLVVVFGLMALVCALLLGTPSAKRTGNLQQDEYCSPSSCGNIGNITSPFHLRGDHRHCGKRFWELVCENNRAVMYLGAGKYYVEDISYGRKKIRLVDVGLDKDFCSITLTAEDDDASIIHDTCSINVTYPYLGDVDSSHLSISSVHRDLIRGYRRSHLSIDDYIESFLQGHNNFMPIRYSYSEIKQMTKCFNDKLGEGGYGSVFKAKLRSGRFVAVKLLGKSKASGQDFISEVGTIGRIHHVNVVELVGFCAEGSKRALVYEFMPNASLDKFIFSGGEKKTPLSWDTIYEIALGVARGIEYLHRGCDMQILHFDIKPHNILLDENFVPKVSDFGLAKLYSTDDSIVSLTAARGTLGYIAPELFYKSIGGVSFKADVYSFGMLLMEMVGRRKNVNACADHSSKIYFPSWIYDRIEQGGDMELGNVSEDVGKLARKMTLVALWCIQMKPMDRPSMSKVLDMLEGEVGLLQIPPKPTFYPQEVSVAEDLGISSSSSDIDISITN